MFKGSQSRLCEVVEGGCEELKGGLWRSCRGRLKGGHVMLHVLVEGGGKLCEVVRGCEGRNEGCVRLYKVV